MNLLIFALIAGGIVGVVIIGAIVVFNYIIELQRKAKLKKEVKPKNEPDRYEYCTQRPTAHAVNRQQYGYNKPKNGTAATGKPDIKTTDGATTAARIIEGQRNIPTSEVITPGETKQQPRDDSETVKLHRPTDL